MMRTILRMTTVMAAAAIALPSFAAVGTPSLYSQTAVTLAAAFSADAEGSAHSEAPVEMCVPPEKHYIPSLVRERSGRVVGMRYTVVEYVC